MIEANKEKTGLFLLMAEKKNHKLIGVCSLSKIDWVNRSAYMAIVMSPFRKRNFVFNSVETKALLTKHAFENLNLNKVRTTQVLELAEWQKYSNLFGYKVEGILRNHYLKGNKYYDVCLHSCLLEDYLKCKKKLGENFWPGKERLFELMKVKTSFYPDPQMIKQAGLNSAMSAFHEKLACVNVDIPDKDYGTRTTSIVVCLD